MNIANIIRRFHFQEWGGTESVVWNTVRHLKQMNVDTKILATAALDKPGIEVREEITIERFPYFYPNWPLSARKKLILDKKGGNPIVSRLPAALSNGKFDLLHCHTMGRVAAVVTKTARKLGIPSVISFHGGCFDIPPAELKEMLAPTRHTFPYGGIIDRLTGMRFDPLAAADGLICVGANEVAPTQERYPGKIVRYFPNGVNAQHFRTPSSFDFRKKYGIPPNRKIMLAVSRIDYQKNQLLLPDVLKLLGEDWHLVCIGPVTAQWYGEKLRQKITELGLNDHCTLIPGLPPDSPELTSAYQSAEVFTLPSLHEPFGIVILEAWSAGIPVVASPVGGINFLVKNQENGMLASPDAPQLWADAIRSLASNPDLRAKVVKNAAFEVDNNYSWSILCRKLVDFYNELIELKHNKH